MIQRLQSLYILFYIINKCYLLYKSSMEKNPFYMFVDCLDPFFLLPVFLIIFSAFTLFNFKNRKIQIKLLYLLIIIQVIILTSILIFSYKVDDPIIFLQNYHTYSYLLGLLLLLLSLRGIKKDQKLIDSIDRIR